MQPQIECLEDIIALSGNLPPVAVADVYTVHQGATLVASPLANDSDAENDPLTPELDVEVVAEHGYAYFDGNGDFHYQSYGGFVGAEILSYRIADGSAYSAFVDLGIQVANTAPILVDDLAEVHQGQAAVFTPAEFSSDADGDVLTFVIEASPSHGYAYIDGAGASHYQSYGNFVGLETVAARVFDGAEYSGTLWILVTNTAPILTTDVVEVHQGQSAVFTPLEFASDTDGDALSFVLDSQAAHGYAYVDGAGYLHYQSYGGFTGVETLALCVYDGSQYSDTRSLEVTNAAPTLVNPGSFQAVRGDVVFLGLQASDADGDPLSFIATGLPLGLGIDSNTGVISGTISNSVDTSEPYSVTVTVGDGTDNTSTSFTWSISQAQVVVSLGEQWHSAGQEVSVTPEFSGVPNHTLGFSATGLPPGLSIDSSTGEIHGTIQCGAESDDTYSVTITATDSAAGVVADATVIWYVYPVEVTFATPDDQENIFGADVQLGIIAWSSDLQNLRFEAIGLPSGLSIDEEAGLISGTINASEEAIGAYSVTVTATNDAAQVNQSVSFAWLVRLLAVVRPDDRQNLVGDQVSVAIHAPYAGVGALAYSAVGLPAGLAIDAATGVISGVTGGVADAEAPYEVVVSVSDGTLTANKTFYWDVKKLFLQDRGDQSSIEGDQASIDLASLVTHLSGNTISFSVSGLPQETYSITDGMLTWNVLEGADANGPYLVTITATDVDAGASAAKEFLWTVAQPLRTPLIRWETAEPLGTEVAAGRLYRVRLAGNRWITVMRTIVQDQEDARYWCHGFSFGGNLAAGGPFSPDGASARAIVGTGCQRIAQGDAQVGDIVLWFNERGVSHSAVLTQVLVQSGSPFFQDYLDLDRTLLSSKDIFSPLRRNISLGAICTGDAAMGDGIRPHNAYGNDFRVYRLDPGFRL